MGNMQDLHRKDILNELLGCKKLIEANFDLLFETEYLPKDILSQLDTSYTVIRQKLEECGELIE